jgi:hypothetical protein
MTQYLPVKFLLFIFVGVAAAHQLLAQLPEPNSAAFESGVRPPALRYMIAEPLFC